MIEMWRKSSKSDGCDEQEATGSENPPEPQFTTPNRPNKRKHLEMVEHAPEQTLGDMNFKLDIGVEAPIGHQHSVIDAWCCFLSNEKEGRIGTALVGFLLLPTQRLKNSSTQWFSPTPAETEGLSSGSLIANDRDVEEAVKAILEGSYNKSSMSHAKDEFEEESDEWKQPSVKPPLHFSVEQHSISSETLLVSADLVFNGHGGTDAASFVRNNILKFIIKDSCFPICLEKAIKNAFLKADYAFVDDSSVDTSSDTKALTALLCERSKKSTTTNNMANLIAATLTLAGTVEIMSTIPTPMEFDAWCCVLNDREKMKKRNNPSQFFASTYTYNAETEGFSGSLIDWKHISGLHQT
nr:probable protein phosphatase 2C 27 isoform X3 [Ipomoea trifida]